MTGTPRNVFRNRCVVSQVIFWQTSNAIQKWHISKWEGKKKSLNNSINAHNQFMSPPLTIMKFDMDIIFPARNYQPIIQLYSPFGADSVRMDELH